MTQTLADIKATLGLTNITVEEQSNQEGVKTGWHTNWDNDTRTRIAIHKDTLAHVKANPQANDLGLQKKKLVSEASGTPYTLYIIVKYTAKGELTTI